MGCGPVGGPPTFNPWGGYMAYPAPPPVVYQQPPRPAPRPAPVAVAPAVRPVAVPPPDRLGVLLADPPAVVVPSPAELGVILDGR